MWLTQPNKAESQHSNPVDSIQFRMQIQETKKRTKIHQNPIFKGIQNKKKKKNLDGFLDLFASTWIWES